MFENSSRTELSDLGEFGLISHITKNFSTFVQPTTKKGVGDDAAVLGTTKNELHTLISTDMLTEGVHFDLSYMPLKHLGYKSIAVNLSDICAMNALPTQVLVSIGISNRFSLEAIEELYEGIRYACDEYQVDLIGGDTVSSKAGLVISVTAIGQAAPESIAYRNGAKEYDLICVSGDLGAAFVGLQYLEREKRIFLEHPEIQPDLAGHDYVVERQLKPHARLDVVKALAESGIVPTSMIDISDGLSSELMHLGSQSQKGMTIYEEKLPIDPLAYQDCIDIGLEATMCALNGGEDYELLFTIPQTDFDKVRSLEGISVIGHVTADEGKYVMISKQQNEYKLEAQGWKHL